eukprot:10475721-Alexandrium_andersonii.AAC.1
MAWCRVAQLAEKGSTRNRPKVRPLKAANAVRELARGFLTEAGKKQIVEAFRPHQFAVGVAGGAEAMAKAT